MSCHAIPENEDVEPNDRDLDTHRRALFGLCYRMTGSAADAEDLVQDTFRRALERPPADQTAPLRPWLLTVATRLCIDALRKRKREGYFGPWLPSPVETVRLDDLGPSPEARYSALESASAAFLLALEALDPKQRAVLILRDVLGLSGPETASILEMSAANVRVVLHRARKTLEGYDAERRPLTEARRQRARALLRRFMAAFSTGDFDGMKELLAEDCRTITDAGGEFRAAVREVRGPDATLELYRNLARTAPKPTWMEEQDHNGLPALALTLPVASKRDAPRLVIQLDIDEDGRVTRISSVLASRKLVAVRFGPASSLNA